MKLSSLQIFATLFATVIGAETSDVVDLSEATFQDHIDSHKLVLAEFFAPWCGHCKNLAPEYEIVASNFKDNKDISVAKVDCTENQVFCQSAGVQGFPTLVLYEDGKKSENYEGPRKAPEIENYLIRRSKPVVTELKDSKSLQKWVKDNQETSPVLVVYLGPKKHLESYTEVARTKRDTVTFLSVSDASVREKFNSDLVIFKADNGKDPIALPSDTELSKEAISDFIRDNEFPSFGELGPDTYSAYINHGLPMLYAFVDDLESRESIKKAVTPHLDVLKGKANFVFLNATLFGAHTQNMALRDNVYPAMVVHDVKSNKKYIHDQDTDLSDESIADFIKKYVAGEITPQIKSEEIPETQDEPVFQLVGKQYDEIVLDDTKDVLVEYYAPWCGHCKNLKPIYDELGEQYKGDDRVVIAQLDNTLNEVPDEIRGYPTIILYPAGKKDSPIVFDGSRTLESLANFVMKEGTHHSSGENTSSDVKDEL